MQAQASSWPDGALVLLGIFALLSTSQLAVALVNWLATLLASPHPLPRMDFSQGIPPALRTLVVVPTMLSSAQNIEDLVEALEVRFLANRDDNLRFGLLTDFQDAHAETLPEDEALLRLAVARIEELNEKYRGVNGDTFFLFHRPRRWNPRDRMWMGYERKRGKLADLNALLRGGAKDRFSRVVGNTEVLANIKYVITLDTDTHLPRDSARQFVGTLAHPLNRARYDEDRQRVVAGYGILQPRMGVSLPGTNRSRYARLYGDEPGIDPYTRAVSDVYHDLFGEGSFIGKGIYDIDAFERSLKDRFPENRILSHDLLEGCYARAGLVSDVLLYEEYPSRYSADVSRRHRWIRGGLAACRLAAAARSRSRCAPAEEPAVVAVAMETFRQPAAQSRAGGVDAAVAAGLDGFVIGLVLDIGGDRNHPDPVLDGLYAGAVQEAGRRAAGPASRRGRTRPSAGASPKRPLLSHAFPMKRSSVWMRLRARRDGCCSRASGFSNGIHRANRIATAARTSPPLSGRCGPPRLSPLARRWFWRCRVRPRWSWRDRY